MDKKLTDAEIVKALECCIPSYNKKCDMLCPYEKLKPTVLGKTLCSEYMRQDIFDLINHYEEKNSNLTSDLTSLQNDLTSAKAEIDYWKRNAFDGCMERGRIEKTAKAEAYKEFAERLKEKLGNTDLAIRFVDNLVKELVGEDNAK